MLQAFFAILCSCCFVVYLINNFFNKVVKLNYNTLWNLPYAWVFGFYNQYG